MTAAPVIQRTFDPALLNRIANDPEVRPWLEGDGPIDISQAIANWANVALVGEEGGFLALQFEPGLYEVHTIFSPACRGQAVAAVAAEALRWMFTRTECVELVTKIADDHMGAILAGRRGGFEPRFSRASAWVRPNGEACPATFYSLSFDRWVWRDDALLDAGHAFHDTLNAAAKRDGVTWPEHPDDPAHDRMAGACMLMSLGGQPAKAVILYNRWARLAGYPLIRLIPQPPLIDVDGAICRSDCMEVLTCHSV